MLISDSYRAEQAKLHATGTYGTAGGTFGDVVTDMLKASKSSQLLDYGCGSNQSLRSALYCPVDYRGYDPAVPEYSADPEPAECVACIDVLEHIEPESLDEVLDHIRSKTLKRALISVHLEPAMKVLSDGRNAHLILKPPAWWLPKLMQRWELMTYIRRKRSFVVALAV